MDRNKLFSLLTYSQEKDNDELGMMLSNNADMGSANGCLISVKAFDGLVEDIKEWRLRKNKAEINCDNCEHLKIENPSKEYLSIYCIKTDLNVTSQEVMEALGKPIVCCFLKLSSEEK